MGSEKYFGKIINVHSHASKFAKFGCEVGTVEDLLEDMEEGGISKSLVFSGVPNTKMWGEGEYGLNEIANKIKGEDKLSLVATINLNEDVNAQLKEAEPLAKKGIVKAVKILLGYFYFYPTDKKLYPIYDFCIKQDIPVIFHTGDTLFESAKVKYAHPLHIDDLAVDFPNLKIVMAHIGNPWTVDAGEVLYKNKNVYADISALFISQIEKEDLDIIIQRVKEMISYAGSDKLMFGTDFPLIDSKTYLSFVDKLGLNDGKLQKLLFKTAKEVFKL